MPCEDWEAHVRAASWSADHGEALWMNRYYIELRLTKVEIMVLRVEILVVHVPCKHMYETDFVQEHASSSLGPPPHPD